MIAAWMLFATVAGSALALTALALERAARMLRRPARYIWLGALAATLFLTVARAPRTTALGDAWFPQAPATSTQSAAPAPARPAPAAIPLLRAWDTIALPARLSALDLPLLALWLAGSLLWGAILLLSARRVRRQRRAWRPELLEGTPVLVSHDVGPALLGIGRYSIVVPAWVLGLEAWQRRLVLGHEAEHARAGDPLTLLEGALAVLLQPWNPAVWLMFQRLRFAVEADCDARVLASSGDVRAYGETLLELGERTLAGAMPVAALSEPKSHLGRRVMLMTQLPLARPLLRSLPWLAAALVVATAAYALPRPVLVAPPQEGRALVHIRSMRIAEGTGSGLPVLVFASGPARVGIGSAAPAPLKDTLRLSAFTPLTLDVTEGEVHLRAAPGTWLQIDADVTGGPATHLGATGTELVLLKGGFGVRVPDLGEDGAARSASGVRRGDTLRLPGLLRAVSARRGDTLGMADLLRAVSAQRADTLPAAKLLRAVGAFQQAEQVPPDNQAQVIFERYLADENMTAQQAADALTDLMIARKKAGLPMAGLHRPADWPPSARAMRRADALFAELERLGRSK